MDLGIAGRRAAVAAASSGLGLAIAQALVTEGVQVAVCSRSRERVEAAGARLGAAACLVADMTDPGEAAGFVRGAQERLGGVDILVTNAGGPPAGNFRTTPGDRYEEAFRLNCLSAIAMCEAAVPSMCERGWGRVVGITSIGVRQPIANLILSNTARSGLTAFLRTLAREIAADGVTVNSLQPGFHRTQRILDLHDDAGIESLAASIPAGTLGEPADFGSVAAFLCSEQARYLTGATIQVDGGSYEGLL